MVEEENISLKKSVWTIRMWPRDAFFRGVSPASGHTMRGHKMDHLATTAGNHIISTTAVAVKDRFTPGFPATAVVEFVSAHGSQSN